MNKTLGSTLIVATTMIGAGMLAMPLTSAGLGLSLTVLLLLALWALLTFTALLFAEAYQTARADTGIGTLVAQFYGRPGQLLATVVLLVFLYALLSAYVTGGGDIFASFLPRTGSEETTSRLAMGLFTLVFGTFVVVGTQSVDGINRLLSLIMLAAFIVVLALIVPNISLDHLLALPIDQALLISAAPVFFTAFGFHGSIPSLNRYLGGDVRALRLAIIVGSAITLLVYIIWQLAMHGIIGQTDFIKLLRDEPTLQGLIRTTRETTGSALIASTLQIFAAIALITSFLGVSLGLFECIEDILKTDSGPAPHRLLTGVLTFLPPVLFAWFYPEGFILALRYAGQMFAFYAVVLPVVLILRVRQQHPNLAYRVMGGRPLLYLALLLGIIICLIPFFVRTGYLPEVVG